jgi:hypothetical protein
MASFDLDSSEPPDDVDDLLAWRLWHQSDRTRAERSTLWIDHDDPATEGDIAQASTAIGQPIQRRPA